MLPLIITKTRRIRVVIQNLPDLASQQDDRQSVPPQEVVRARQNHRQLHKFLVVVKILQEVQAKQALKQMMQNQKVEMNQVLVDQAVQKVQMVIQILRTQMEA